MIAYIFESGMRVTEILPPVECNFDKERASLCPSSEGDASAMIT